MTIYILDLMDELRTGRLSDHGGDIATTGSLLYKWQDKDYPVLNWTNPDLMRYFNWALVEIGKREPIIDSVGSISTIAVAANVAEYSYSSLIMTIEEVYLASTGRPLIKETREHKEEDVLFGTHFSGTNWRTETDEAPTRYIEDITHRKIRLWPIPTQTDTLRLVTKRRYSCMFEWSTVLAAETTLTSSIFGFPDELREALLCGAASRAFLKRGEDTYDRGLAREYETEFDSYVGPKVDWRTLETRRLMANQDVQIVPHPYTPKIKRNRTFYGETTNDDDF